MCEGSCKAARWTLGGLRNVTEILMAPVSVVQVFRINLSVVISYVYTTKLDYFKLD